MIWLVFDVEGVRVPVRSRRPTAAQWLAGARLRTLPAAIAPVLAGTGVAAATKPGGVVESGSYSLSGRSPRRRPGPAPAAWTYTGGPWPYGYHALGEVVVFLFFGLVAVLGTAYLQTRAVTGTGLAVAVAMGSFAGAILVANNLRDVASDGRAGKRTLAVVLGARRTQVVFGGLLALPFVACLSVAGGRGHRADRSGAGRRRGALWSALVGRCARRSFDSAVNERANTLRWPRGPRRYELAILAELRAFRPQAFVRPLAASPTPWSWLGPETTPGTTMTWVKVGTAAASPTPWSWLGPGTAARTLPGVRLGCGGWGAAAKLAPALSATPRRTGRHADLPRRRARRRPARRHCRRTAVPDGAAPAVPDRPVRGARAASGGDHPAGTGGHAGRGRCRRLRRRRAAGTAAAAQ